ncbi:MAG TPA: diacylglycerol kinase family protein [Myxococcota bacterium]|nr:diacylglycerol kinase family protein [Myxococcota bacterium]
MSWLAERAASFRFALRGLAAFSREANARIHAAVALAVIVLAASLGVDRRDWALLALAIGLVLAAEAINTALEALADHVAPGIHPRVARVKDIAAAGVLLAALAAAAVGLLVFWKPLLARLVS